MSMLQAWASLHIKYFIISIKVEIVIKDNLNIKQIWNDIESSLVELVIFHTHISEFVNLNLDYIQIIIGMSI